MYIFLPENIFVLSIYYPWPDRTSLYLYCLSNLISAHTYQITNYHFYTFWPLVRGTVYKIILVGGCSTTKIKGRRQNSEKLS